MTTADSGDLSSMADLVVGWEVAHTTEKMLFNALVRRFGMKATWQDVYDWCTNPDAQPSVSWKRPTRPRDFQMETLYTEWGGLGVRLMRILELPNVGVAGLYTLTKLIYPRLPATGSEEQEERNEMGTACPRCGGPIPSEEHAGEYPGALSRWDNITEICSSCGTEEAMLQYSAQGAGPDYRQLVVHPTRGERPWAVLEPHRHRNLGDRAAIRG